MCGVECQRVWNALSMIRTPFYEFITNKVIGVDSDM